MLGGRLSQACGPMVIYKVHSRGSGGVQRGPAPSDGGSRGCPPDPQDIPRAGGWEEGRPCYGDHAHAAHAYRGGGQMSEAPVSCRLWRELVPAGSAAASGWPVFPWIEPLRVSFAARRRPRRLRAVPSRLPSGTPRRPPRRATGYRAGSCFVGLTRRRPTPCWEAQRRETAAYQLRLRWERTVVGASPREPVAAAA